VFLGNSVNYPAFWRLALLGVALLGIWHMIRAVGAWTGVLLVGPVGAVTILSLAHMYPLSDRTLLSLAPVCILSVVAGLDALTEFVRPSARAAVFACGMVGVLGPPAVDAIRWWRAGPDPRELRATTARVWHDVQRGEPVYIFSRDVPVWTFYTTDWTHPDTARVRALLAMAASTGPNAGNAPTRSGPVLGEGSTLVLRDSGRTELVGVPTGMEDTYLGARSRTPDSGWAVNEATRVRQVASPDAWLFFTYWNERVDQWLLDSLRTGGGRITAQVVGPTIRVYQYDSR
jgi:antitoxin (DNA-binding transcriptional repressor) of toxin-antitoxin stability system